MKQNKFNWEELKVVYLEKVFYKLAFHDDIYFFEVIYNEKKEFIIHSISSYWNDIMYY